MADSQTTRPLTDEQWMYWQKLVSDEHDTQAAEIERLRSWLREIGRNPVAPTPNAIERIITNV
jgi:hypothetical protein